MRSSFIRRFSMAFIRKRAERGNCKRCSAVSGSALLMALCVAFCLSAQGQNRIVVDTGKAVNVLTDTSLGIPATTVDANSFNMAGAAYLRAAGITSVRFPGNGGIADLYHWSTRTTSP